MNREEALDLVDEIERALPYRYKPLARPDVEAKNPMATWLVSLVPTERSRDVVTFGDCADWDEWAGEHACEMPQVQAKTTLQSVRIDLGEQTCTVSPDDYLAYVSREATRVRTERLMRSLSDEEQARIYQDAARHFMDAPALREALHTACQFCGGALMASTLRGQPPTCDECGRPDGTPLDYAAARRICALIVAGNDTRYTLDYVDKDEDGQYTVGFSHAGGQTTVQTGEQWSAWTEAASAQLQGGIA